MTRVTWLGLSREFYLYQLRRWVLFALIPALLCATIAYLYGERQQKTYAATAVLYVQQTQASPVGGSANTDVFGSQQLATTYAAMIVDDTIARAADRRLARKYPGYAANYTASQTTQKLAQQSTQLFSVTAIDVQPARAVDGANTVARVFIGRIRRLDRQRFSQDEARLQQQAQQAQGNVNATLNKIQNYHGSADGLSALRTELSAFTTSYSTLITSLNAFRATRDASLANISIFSAATQAGQTGPHPTRTALLAGLIVLLLASGLLYLRGYLHDFPRSPEDIEAAAGAPVLGTVPRYAVPAAASKLLVFASPSSPPAESYRLIRTNLLYTNVDRPPRSLLITSALPSEGKSTTVGNLAQAFAEVSARVAVIDSDLRRPSQRRLFGLADDAGGGLTGMLVSGHELNGNDRGVRLADVENLYLLASGPTPPNPSNLLGSERMRTLLAHVVADSSVTLIDSPPVLAAPDAAILSTMVDGTILVIDPESARRRDIRASRLAIEAVGGTIVGVVLNRLRPRGAMYYYYSAYERSEHPRSIGQRLRTRRRT